MIRTGWESPQAARKKTITAAAIDHIIYTFRKKARRLIHTTFSAHNMQLAPILKHRTFLVASVLA